MGVAAWVMLSALTTAVGGCGGPAVGAEQSTRQPDGPPQAVETISGPAAPTAPDAVDIEPPPVRRCLPVVTTCGENLPCELVEGRADGRALLLRTTETFEVQERCHEGACTDALIYVVPSGCGGEDDRPLVLDCQLQDGACVSGGARP